ncbi:MAG: hypothetical protein EPO39_02480 [Candidatus Manganitrophaceae bacterium]|nr:MAG: hypothetical protein EPO39_02480 [Candidatus Manganitrophaceae bacterium]
MNRKIVALVQEKLKDERGKKVIFLSHCLLNQNVRYLGGAFRRGCVEEVVEAFIQNGAGLCQLRCPEQQAWGGVLKSFILNIYGSKGTLLYSLRRFWRPLFIGYTKWIYRRLANEAVKEIEDYLASGFTVIGVVGIGGSPSCGVETTLDIGKSLDVLAGCPLSALSRWVVNEEAVAGSLSKGPGLFMKAIRRRLARKGLDVKFYEHDLIAEMKDRPLLPLEVSP